MDGPRRIRQRSKFVWLPADMDLWMDRLISV